MVNSSFVMEPTPRRRRDFFIQHPRYIYYDKNGEEELMKNKNNFFSFLILVGR